jgi:molecular chaperone HtpG
MSQGKINITTENIFPIIKKFLYSDHEIFLRELISNAVDATQKLKTLASAGDFKGEMGDLTINVKIDKEAKTLTFSDKGIGMTGEEIQKYIAELAFSGAEEFVEKYKDKANAIIGHFGLGFYSSFMVSERVEIVSKSYREDTKAARWICDGSPEYTLEEAEEEERGTDIILHIAEDSVEFLEDSKINALLSKYCKFLPIPIAFGEETDWKDGKEEKTGKLKIINNTEPAWTKKPADLKDEDYKDFYRELYPMTFDEPLFNIHLNVDYPFNLTGILYFPRIKKNLEIQKNKIQLFSNQVFVTDSVEGIVPEFLTLLHGVLDSPDIPLNVSRSYLQSDQNVKKISSHINKKVSDRLKQIFKDSREDFEKKWDDLKLFIQYGMLSDEKFYERAKEFCLLKNTDGKVFSFDEYHEVVKINQTDKNENVIYLYTTSLSDQYTFIQEAKDKGYDVLLMDGQLDSHFIHHLESKLEKTQFRRVDAEIVSKLIEKDEKEESKLTQEQKDELIPVFRSQLPLETNYTVMFEGMSEAAQPMIITQSEFMRRMKEMAHLGGGMGFYGELPDSYNLVVNANHPLIHSVMKQKDEAIGEEIKNIEAEIIPLESEKTDLETLKKGKEEEEIDQIEKDKLEEVESKIRQLKDKKEGLLNDYGKQNKIVKQLIDLALLANGMLKGEELTRFVKRSVELIEQ